MKSYTDIEQSKKLAEILPIESADMCYRAYMEEGGIPDYGVTLCPYQFASWIGVPCWSLAALLNYMRETDYFPDILADEHSVEMSVIYCDNEEGNTLHPFHKISVEEETFVDAVVNLIVKLKEQELI